MLPLFDYVNSGLLFDSPKPLLSAYDPLFSIVRRVKLGPSDKSLVLKQPLGLVTTSGLLKIVVLSTIIDIVWLKDDKIVAAFEVE
jgi:hypothetical protein